MKEYDTEGWQILNKDLSETAKLVGDNAYLLAIRRTIGLTPSDPIFISTR